MTSEWEKIEYGTFQCKHACKNNEQEQSYRPLHYWGRKRKSLLVGALGARAWVRT
jgi:hypothetical protein